MSTPLRDPARYYLTLPDPSALSGIKLSLQDNEDDPRTKQLQICREMVVFYLDVLVSPSPGSFTDITVVMTHWYFMNGFIQRFGETRRLKVTVLETVSSVTFQCCVAYSLVTRMSPCWNKVGSYLAMGRDFLSEKGRLHAVGMQTTTNERHVCFKIKAYAIYLRPITLQDLNLPPLALKRFYSDQSYVLGLCAIKGQPIWCHVLPSMKKGQIMSISHQLPEDGPFRNYRDMQAHWANLYGYALPGLREDEKIYCNVCFGEKLYTYPLSCIRLKPVQRLHHIDLQESLGRFVTDFKVLLNTVCGLIAHVSDEPGYPEVKLNKAPSAQVSSGPQVNPSSSSSSRRPVVPQLPAPPALRVEPSFRPQPPSCNPPSQERVMLVPSDEPHPAVYLTVKADHLVKLRETSKQTATAAPSSSKGKEDPHSDAPAPSSSNKKEEPHPDPSSSSKRGEVKPRTAVEEMARRNQLWKVTSVTLVSWLRGRGVHVDAKVQKAELIQKVMGCLAKA